MLNAAGLDAARKFASALDRTQYYSAERMRAYQRNLLEPLLRHARAEVPFYEKRLDPLFGSNDEIRWDAWVDIPTVTREDAQVAGEQMFARNLPEPCGVVENGETSGSTGRHLNFRTNSLMRLLASGIGERIFAWHNVDRAKAAAFIIDYIGKHPMPNGSSGNFWNITEPDASGFNLSLGYTVEEQVQWLTKTDAKILFTYPSNASAILKHYQDNDLSAPFDTIVCHGECLTEEVHKFLSNNDNINVVDRYGASEIGPLSTACPNNNAIHHQFAETYLLENLEYDSNAVISTGTGRMVATPFYNYAMPLIRYENYDHIETDDRLCSCGRTLPIIKKIHGRRRNLFKFSDGRTRWPNLQWSTYNEFLPARQIQFIQTTTSHIEIHYVHDGSSTQPDIDKMRKYMQQKLNEEFDIELIRTTEIAKPRSGKFEDCISLVE